MDYFGSILVYPPNRQALGAPSQTPLPPAAGDLAPRPRSG